MTAAAHFHWDEVATLGDARADRRSIAGHSGNLKRVGVEADYIAERHEHAFEQFFIVQ